MTKYGQVFYAEIIFFFYYTGAILAIGRGGRETTLCTLTKSNFLTEELLF